jgi:hypothetical protein
MPALTLSFRIDLSIDFELTGTPSAIADLPAFVASRPFLESRPEAPAGILLAMSL